MTRPLPTVTALTVLTLSMGGCAHRGAHHGTHNGYSDPQLTIWTVDPQIDNSAAAYNAVYDNWCLAHQETLTCQVRIANMPPGVAELPRAPTSPSRGYGPSQVASSSSRP